MKIVLTMDWEGLSLQSRNLNRIEAFKTHRDIPWVHYMNPAYFTQKQLKKQAETAVFNQVIGDKDEWGLHLHGPKHLIEASGLEFKKGPYFSQQGEAYSGDWVGQEMMLHTYSASELKTLMNFSKQVFIEQGFPEPKSFRAGGWMMDPYQMNCLVEAGFTFDSSATSAECLKDSCWQGDQLERYIELIWGNIKKTTQPYKVNSHLLEVPNNLGAIDYWKDPVEQAHFAMVSSHQGQDVWVVTAHQETAAEHLGKLDTFLEQLENSNFELEFHTNQSLLQTLPSFH